MSITTNEPNKKPTCNSHNVEQAVRKRYSAAAQAREAELCCPVDYNPRYLKAIPEEILQRDYGCGDPSQYLKPGEVVLDLGSGGGKICYIAAQVVGAEGSVIGVDCNDDMLALARKHQPAVSEKLGYDNIDFRKGSIQDLQLNLDLLEEHLQKKPVVDSHDWLLLEEYTRELRKTQPLIDDASVDVIVSNCVLNLVRNEEKRSLFQEMARVLRRGGRAVISDIVSDEIVPEHLQQDSTLWSGCMSGAFREDQFLAAFEEAGFYGISILERQEKPWAVVDGIEFRSLTVQAFQGKEGPCLDRKQAVVYNGPWKSVLDDEGHTLYRGERMAVCDRTFTIYSQPPYQNEVTLLMPQELIPLSEAEEISCQDNLIRSSREMKKQPDGLTILPENNCCADDDCC